MRVQERKRCAVWILFAALAAPAARPVVVDRIAVIVGKTVITESEVLREARLTEFLNQQPLDLGPGQRRAAAERLVDQQLIRNEMEIGRYPMPAPAEAGAMLQKFREERHFSDAKLRQALAKYGLTEDQLKRQFLWQLAAMRFTDQRFAVGLIPPPNATAAHASPAGEASRTQAPGTTATNGTANRVPAGPGNGGEGAANRLAPGEEPRADQGKIDQALDAWLKQARASTRIQFKKDAFQ
jgi:hypothetical protein